MKESPDYRKIEALMQPGRLTRDGMLGDDRRSLARYASDCIEKFGTGGGNFRTMYAEFLRQARATVPDLVPAEAPDRAALAATRWSELASHLAELAEDAGEEVTERAVEALSRIVVLETQLFESLAARAQATA